MGVGYAETSRGLAKGEERFTKALTYIKPTDLVVDLGCNDGSFTELLAGKSADAVGIDFPEVIERAKASRPNLRFMGAELSTVNFEPESLDAIVALGLIEHVPDDFGLLQRCRIWLKSGGRLILTTPLSPEKIIEEDSAHVRFYPPYSLLRLLIMAGFGVRDITIFHEVDEYMIIGEVPDGK